MLGVERRNDCSNRPLTLRSANGRALGRQPAPELHQLAVFLHVVEAGSFTGAARRLGCSQPAISQTIRRLEEIYGGDLFARRRGAALALTPVGKAVLPSVRRVLDEVDRQIADATGAAQSRGGTLSVGFCPGLFAGRLRVGMTTFSAAAPRVRLQFVEGTPDTLRAALGRQRLDIMVSPLPGTLDGTQHESEFLWNEPLLAALPGDDPRVGREIDGLALYAARLLWPPYINESCRALVTGVESGDELGHEVSPTTILDLVAMGVGTGIIPATAALARPSIEFRPIDDDNAQIAIHASWLRHDANPIRHRLLRHLRAAASAD